MKKNFKAGFDFASDGQDDELAGYKINGPPPNLPHMGTPFQSQGNYTNNKILQTSTSEKNNRSQIVPQSSSLVNNTTGPSGPIAGGKILGIQSQSKKKLIEHIPCLFLPHEEGGNKVVLYFHGNAEDIGLAFDLLYLFGQRMNMHVMAVEYPGYGLYKTSKSNETQIK